MIPTALVLDLAEVIDPRYRALVLLAGFASLRTGENLGLRRMDVDLLHAEVSVLVQAQQIGGRGRIVKEPKSDAGLRTVVLPTVVVEALDHHLATYARPGPGGAWSSPAPKAAQPGGPRCPMRGPPHAVREARRRAFAFAISATMPPHSPLACGAGLGLTLHRDHTSERASEQHLYLEAASGIKPLYGALQALPRFPGHRRLVP